MIQPERIQFLNRKDEAPDRKAVVYWMQSAQRTEYNHALEYAIRQANRLGKPLIAYFGLTDGFPEANERHYRFMLEGLNEVREELRKRGVRLFVLHHSPELGAMEFSKLASLLVVDRGYLRVERQWRDFVAENALCPVIQVETNVVVPVETTSPKEEYAAATIRRKIHKQLDSFFVPLKESICQTDAFKLDLPFSEFQMDDVEAALGKMNIDRSVKASPLFRGGSSEGKKRLAAFLEQALDRFGEDRNEPGLSLTSNLSPYLHFGQISPLFVALEAKKHSSPGLAAFLEELIVRRELSMNFVFYNQRYDSIESLPDWAKGTLEKHRKDSRSALYTREDLEYGNTHDPYWNAAQEELRVTGEMHGYMRMYWGKKLLEWAEDPETAYQTALVFNNKYALDGRDPNGFAGVAWCFGKHDRPWQERPVFGTVRYMNDKGLERKFNMKRYLEKVQSLPKRL